ncbi:unnamed protein product [Moneuplotes crassus]|uniref:Uncharacterized protein n=1 Tax=Euplotes crassus TaxID=5936 RepID=A0AAD2D5U9_EUPCR|nr:unnamed protein product [Moneuplotes crassus]
MKSGPQVNKNPEKSKYETQPRQSSLVNKGSLSKLGRNAKEKDEETTKKQEIRLNLSSLDRTLAHVHNQIRKKSLKGGTRLSQNFNSPHEPASACSKDENNTQSMIHSSRRSFSPPQFNFAVLKSIDAPVSRSLYQKVSHGASSIVCSKAKLLPNDSQNSVNTTKDQPKALERYFKHNPNNFSQKEGQAIKNLSQVNKSKAKRGSKLQSKYNTNPVENAQPAPVSKNKKQMFKVSKQKYLNKCIRSRLRPKTKYDKKNSQPHEEVIDCYNGKEMSTKYSKTKLVRTNKAQRNLNHSKEFGHNEGSVGNILSPIRTSAVKYTQDSSVESLNTGVKNRSQTLNQSNIPVRSYKLDEKAKRGGHNLRNSGSLEIASPSCQKISNVAERYRTNSKHNSKPILSAKKKCYNNVKVDLFDKKISKTDRKMNFLSKSTEFSGRIMTKNFDSQLPIDLSQNLNLLEEYIDASENSPFRTWNKFQLATNSPKKDLQTNPNLHTSISDRKLFTKNIRYSIPTIPNSHLQKPQITPLSSKHTAHLSPEPGQNSLSKALISPGMTPSLQSFPLTHQNSTKIPKLRTQKYPKTRRK